MTKFRSDLGPLPLVCVAEALTPPPSRDPFSLPPVLAWIERENFWRAVLRGDPLPTKGRHHVELHS